MTELEFAQRLKEYRKARGMTQQELADRLGVSNKSVSRWETGGYPDVALLGPLAKALGVTVDDLLGEQPAAVRALGRADWQNLLSFAFAIGGGVGFFLLDLFLPTILALLLYLGCLAYGVWLQKNYTFHSRWFFSAALVMSFFIYFQTILRAATLLAPSLISNLLLQLASCYSPRGDAPALEVVTGYLLPLLTGALPLLLGTLVATGVTALAIWLFVGSRRLRLSRAAFSPGKALPALCPLLCGGFYLLYCGGVTQQYAPLPGWLYVHQGPLFYTLLGALTLICVIWLLARRRRAMLPPALLLCALCLAFPLLAVTKLMYAISTGHCYLYNPEALNQRYAVFQQAGPALLIVALVLAGAWLLCCFVTTRPREDV